MKIDFSKGVSIRIEDGVYIIQNELLDVIGTGENQAEAMLSFAEEFDFLYRRLHTLNDSQLTEHMKRVKLSFALFIQNIEEA